ncbi:lipoate--protein ligase family protein [Pseudomonas sp. LRF_L74]|uniref:lipoate--protein ligase family protein n=1 Tax=Pseudomonas sp. LRF_L74 TaxID=3369422 RepID=UPI003F5F660F
MSELLYCTVDAGLEAERQLLDRVHGGEIDSGLLLWSPCDQALVMPRKFSRESAFASATSAVEHLGWPVLLRDTGGEPVPQSPAVLNVALVYAMPASDDEQARIETAYQRLCQPICDWLRSFELDSGTGEVPGAFCDGRFNVTLERRKLAGTAQRWRRRANGGAPIALAHAAMLMDDQRGVMVEVVNTFYSACGLPMRCLAESHIALRERLGEPWQRLAELRERYRRALSNAGIGTEG